MGMERRSTVNDRSRSTCGGFTVTIAMTAADQRLFKKAPRQRGHAEGREQGEGGHGEMAERIELRFGVEKDHVREEVEGVMEQVDAVGDAAEPAQKPPARDDREPSGRLRNHSQEEGAIEKGQPRKANGDGDGVHGVHQPPEQTTYTQKEDKQDAVQIGGMMAEEFEKAGIAKSQCQKDAAGESVGAARHQKNCRDAAIRDVAEYKEAQNRRNEKHGGEKADHNRAGKVTDK